MVWVMPDVAPPSTFRPWWHHRKAGLWWRRALKGRGVHSKYNRAVRAWGKQRGDDSSRHTGFGDMAQDEEIPL